MTPTTNPPWWADPCGEFTVIRDADGNAVCLIPRPDDVNARDDQDALAELIAMAPELFACLAGLTHIIRRCDAEMLQPPEDFASDEEYDAALDDAQALLDLLAESGVLLGAAA